MIRIGFSTFGIALTGDLPDAAILTDCEYADFRLLHNGVAVFEGRYFALDGRAVVSGLSSIVEECLAEMAGMPISEFAIEATDQTGTASQEFEALYCSADLDIFSADQWLAENFLTLAPCRRLPPDGFISLMWYAKAKESLAVNVSATFLGETGEKDTINYAHSGNGLVSIMSDTESVVLLLSDIEAAIRLKRKIQSLTLQSVTVKAGNRSASFFVDQSLKGLRPFWYANCFNVPEQLVLPRVTTEKLKTDRSLAVIGRSSRFYDVTSTKEYEVQTGPLAFDEHLQIEQMLASPSVRIPWGSAVDISETDFEAMEPILITDFTCELSDTDEKPNAVKFTWRFAENRPNAVAPYSPGIFNDKFNTAYT